MDLANVDQLIESLKNRSNNIVIEFGTAIKTSIPNFDERIRNDVKLAAELFLIERQKQKLKAAIASYFEELKTKRKELEDVTQEIDRTEQRNAIAREIKQKAREIQELERQMQQLNN